MKSVFQKPYIYWTIGIFFVYLVLNFAISGFYKNIPLITAYASTLNWTKLILSLLLSIAIGILISINAVYVYIRHKERKNCLKGETIATAGTFAGLGTVGGLATGICPLCLTGLFPLIFGVLGVSFSFASLPFGGIEVQVLTILILLFSLNILKK